MNKRASTSIIFIIILLIISLCGAGFFYLSYKKEMKARTDLEEQLDFVKKQKDKLQERVDQITQEKVSLEADLKTKESQVTDLTDKLTKETQAKELAVSEKDMLQKQIDGLAKDKQDIELKLSQKDKDLVDLKGKLDAALLEKKELERNIAKAAEDKSAETLGKIVVNPSSLESDKAKKENASENIQLEAKVLLVNKEYGFLVLNIGKQNGVVAGDTLMIYHQDVPLGSVQVEKVQNTMSAANFAEGFQQDKVEEGDVAKKII